MNRRISRFLVRAVVAASSLSAAGCGTTAKNTGTGSSAADRRDAGQQAERDAAGSPARPTHDGAAQVPAVSADARPPPTADTGPASPDATTPEAGAGSEAGPLVCNGPGARFATGSPAHSFGPGQNTGQDLFPAPVLGPPKGGAPCNGSTDVVSLGNGGWVVLEFAGDAIVDGPGPDFIVFENPFAIGCDPNQIFAELGTVAVSDDGVTWKEFPCTATAPPYGQCSGWHIVNANADTNDIDPTDPAVAGGDPYDLADLGVKSARYVRITDRADITGQAGVYDLDAVSIVHPACP